MTNKTAIAMGNPVSNKALALILTNPSRGVEAWVDGHGTDYLDFTVADLTGATEGYYGDIRLNDDGTYDYSIYTVDTDERVNEESHIDIDHLIIELVSRNSSYYMDAERAQTLVEAYEALGLEAGFSQGDEDIEYHGTIHVYQNKDSNEAFLRVFNDTVVLDIEEYPVEANGRADANRRLAVAIRMAEAFIAQPQSKG